MAMSFTSKEQTQRAASSSARRSRSAQVDALVMKVAIVTVFVFVGSITFGLL
jgi:hypothetical protein